MDIVVVGSIQVPPQDVLLVYHQLEELHQEVVLGRIQLIDSSVNLFACLAFILHPLETPIQIFL